MNRILIINGPSLHALGKRESKWYGEETWPEIVSWLIQKTGSLNVDVDHFQSHHEGEIVSKIWDSQEGYTGIVLNPGAYAHSSIAILDAMKGSHIPVIEVHLSNVFKREAFRHRLMTAAGSEGVITGCGKYGYWYAIQQIMSRSTP